MLTRKKKIFLITAVVYILYTLFPLFADVFNIPTWLPSMASVGIMMWFYPKAFSNKTFYWFLAYVSVMAIYLMVGHPLTIGIGKIADSSKILIESAFILPAICIFCILYYLKDSVLSHKLFMWSIGILFVSFILEVPLMQQYGSVRAALSDEVEQIKVLGLPSYGLMHAYTLILPVFCYGTKVLTGKSRIMCFVGLLGLCFVIYETFVTTSLLLMIALLVFTILYSEKNEATSFTISVICVFIFMIFGNADFLIGLINWIMPAFQGTAVEFKLNDFQESLIEGQLTGNSITGRMDYHEISRQSFYDNPIFGGSRVGGHSSILDRLGGMGVMGALPFIMIIVVTLRQILKFFTTRMAKVFFYIGIIIGFVFLYNKGNWGFESWLVYMVLMPMGILVFERKTIEQNKSRGLQKIDKHGVSNNKSVKMSFL